MCDRVVWIEKGQVVMQGTPEEVLREYEGTLAPGAPED
jgi:ABC-type polysaccharide/polyol phosphate transport system ATPase subunit